jgi:tRNA(fMet)-specific endonuclease VapC
MWLLDTNAWINYLNYPDSKIKEHLKSHKKEEIVLCDVVISELYYGAYKSKRQKENLELIDKLSKEFVSLPFESISAKTAGFIRAELSKKGTPIGPYDLQIASIAKVNNITVVTHNTKEFTRIDGLKIEDWEES